MNRQEQLLLNITQPDFREGYQKGRTDYFAEAEPLTDHALIELLQCIAADGEFDPARESDLYWHIGVVMGQLSGPLIPYRHDPDAGVSEQALRGVRIMELLGPFAMTTCGLLLKEHMLKMWVLLEQVDVCLRHQQVQREVMRSTGYEQGGVELESLSPTMSDSR